MYQKILVAMDVSDTGKTVFAHAISLAQLERSQLLLLHVLSAEENNSPLSIPDDLAEIYPAAGNDLTLDTWRQQWQDFEQNGLEMLNKRKQEAIERGITAESQQIDGSPGKTICQVAREWHADLVVVGHRGLSGLPEMLLGSVSNYVLHHAHCSVLLVQLNG